MRGCALAKCETEVYLLDNETRRSSLLSSPTLRRQLGPIIRGQTTAVIPPHAARCREAIVPNEQTQAGPNCGRTIWMADAHRDDGKRFVVHADEKLTAFIELESAVGTVERSEDGGARK